MPKIMSALPSRAAAWASAHVPIYFDSSGILRSLAIAPTSIGAAPAMLSPSLYAIAGYWGWPVAVILVQASSAKVAVQIRLRATDTLKHRIRFMIRFPYSWSRAGIGERSLVVRKDKATSAGLNQMSD